jgi:hypothetical protein
MKVLESPDIEIVIRNKKHKPKQQNSTSFSLSDGKTTIFEVREELITYFKDKEKKESKK